MKTVVIGGGMLGLSVAYFLAKRGHEIVLIEKDEKLGGACSWMEIDGVIIDRFYHVILSEDGRIFNFMDELGLHHKYDFTVTKMGIYDGKNTYPMSTPRDFIFYPKINFYNKWRLAYTLFYCQRLTNWKAIEGMTARDFLISVGGNENYNFMWAPIMRAKFGDHVDQLTAVDMHLRIKRLFGSRRKDFSQKMAYIKGTPKTLVDALEKQLRSRGVTILKQKSVNCLSVSNGILSGLKLESGENVEADSFIFTVPVPNFAKLIPDEYADYKMNLIKIKYLDNVSLILKLSRPLTPYYMLNIQVASIPFTGIVGLSHIYPADEFGGDFVFYISKYIFQGEGKEFFSKKKEELLALYLPHLKKINPDFDETWITGYEVSKGRHIEPFHDLHYSEKIPSRTTPFSNAFLLTTAQAYPEITVLNTAIRMAENFVNEFI